MGTLGTGDGTRPYFQSLYGASDDPYGLRTRWYERRKRAVLLAALPQEHYARAYEPGCGIGELSAELAPRCDSLLASDFSDKAVQVARERLKNHPHVTVEQQVLPDGWPREAGPFDLIVLSEVGYFLEAADMDRLAACCAIHLAPGGTLVACDWKPDFAERRLPTADVHAALHRLGLPRLACHEEDDFQLDIWSADGRSVAQREGIR